VLRADTDRAPTSPTLLADDCCDARTNGALPSATAITPAPQAPDAPLVATVPAPSSLDVIARVVASHATSHPTGPPALAHARERAARSMVALI
jgi:hypothetical protein